MLSEREVLAVLRIINENKRNVPPHLIKELIERDFGLREEMNIERANAAFEKPEDRPMVLQSLLSLARKGWLKEALPRLEQLMMEGQIIQAIKEHRTIMDSGLKEAKDWVHDHVKTNKHLQTEANKHVWQYKPKAGDRVRLLKGPYSSLGLTGTISADESWVNLDKGGIFGQISEGSVEKI